LKTEQEKQQRILDDQKWVENFVEKPWDQALKVWNSQAVFQHSSEKTADEKPWPRWAIEKALTSFGLATQEDFRSMVKTTKIPTMYVLGEMDFKYQNMWKEIGFTQHVQKLIILDQGHRVLKGSQEILSTALFNFVIDRFQSTEHAP
jgi:2-succinyl-6-hydroxy-2,4-cyclohexadiene-1-carboxylate synthase